MPTNTSVLALATLLLAACPGQVYDPCVTVDECDHKVADGCATQGGKSWCTKICQTDGDCPECPKGQLVVCVSVEPAGIKACTLP